MQEATLRSYLAVGENPIYAWRRHAAVLAGPVLFWVTCLAGLCFLFSVRRDLASGVGIWVFLVITGYLGCQLWKWSCTQHLVTDRRILCREGVLSHKVSAMSLSKVVDTTYVRSLPGLILGYGTLVLDCPGNHPGFLNVAWVPRPDAVYRMISLLILEGESTALQGGAWIQPEMPVIHVGSRETPSELREVSRRLPGTL